MLFGGDSSSVLVLELNESIFVVLVICCGMNPGDMAVFLKLKSAGRPRAVRSSLGSMKYGCSLVSFC